MTALPVTFQELSKCVQIILRILSWFRPSPPFLGVIPSELGGLTRLQTLSLYNNRLTGKGVGEGSLNVSDLQ